MPSVNKTPNYGLNQWAGNEYAKRQDFVDDNELIDAALKANADASTPTSIRGTILTGLSTATNAVITTADSILTALGKLQKQITDHKSTTQDSLDAKVDKVVGKQLSTEDYTTDYKDKLDDIQAGAQVNTVTSVAGKTGDVEVTKGDVGLGNVENYSIATQAEAEAGTSDVKYMTPLRVLESILANSPNIVTGTYTGNSASSQSISLGARPKAVLVLPINGVGYSHSSGYAFMGLALDGYPAKATDYGTSRNTISITSTGFTVYYGGTHPVMALTNENDVRLQPFRYIAIM